jgi:hypothetical protein
VTIRLAVRGAVRGLEEGYQRQCYLPSVPLARDAARVCMRALEIDDDSVDMLCSKIRLIGLLYRNLRGRQLAGCCAALITTVSRAEDQRIHNTCTAAIFNVYWSLADAGSDMPLLDELRGLLSGKMRPMADPAAAGLLLLLANKPGFAELLRCAVDQLLRRESAQAPVELWFSAALLAPEHKGHGHELGLSRIPFQTALQCLDGPPEVAEPAVALFGGLARLGWGEHAALNGVSHTRTFGGRQPPRRVERTAHCRYRTRHPRETRSDDPLATIPRVRTRTRRRRRTFSP